MSRDTITKVFAVVLVLAAIVVVIIQLRPKATSPVAASKAGTAAAGTKGAKAPAAKDTPELKPVEVNIDELIQDIQPVTFDYEMSSIDRNPMTPLVGVVSPGEQTPEVAQGSVVDVLRKRVTGIVWDAVDPIAIVDDDVVRVGYQYPTGVTVHAIERDKVVFRINDQLVPVELKEL